LEFQLQVRALWCRNLQGLTEMSSAGPDIGRILSTNSGELRFRLCVQGKHYKGASHLANYWADSYGDEGSQK